MTDLTQLVIASSFVLALGVFGISALVRAGFSGNPGASAHTDDVDLDEIPQDPGVGVLPAPSGRRVSGVPVWFYQPRDLVGVGLVFLFYAGLFALSSGASGQGHVLNAGVLLLNIGFQFMIGAMVATFALRRTTMMVWLGLRWPSWPRVFLIAPGVVVLMWLLCGGLNAAGYVDWMQSLGVETVQESVKLLQQSQDPVVLVLMAVAAVIMAPIYEETVFRGFFYPVLKRFAGFWPAVISSSLVFAAAHGSLASLLPLFVFGVLLAWVYEKTGSIWAPMAVHFCFNSATVIGQFLERYLDIPSQPMP